MHVGKARRGQPWAGNQVVGGGGDAGFTLSEVVISVAIAGLVFSGVVYGYVEASAKAEWSGYSLAAQAVAIQQIEQAKSAKWDTQDTPPVNELLNVPAVTGALMDLPVSGTNKVWATNYTTIISVPVTDSIGGTTNVTVYLVRVDTVWPFRWGRQTRNFTNTILDYFAPD